MVLYTRMAYLLTYKVRMSKKIKTKLTISRKNTRWEPDTKGRKWLFANPGWIKSLKKWSGILPCRKSRHFMQVLSQENKRRLFFCRFFFCCFFECLCFLFLWFLALLWCLDFFSVFWESVWTCDNAERLHLYI